MSVCPFSPYWNFDIPTNVIIYERKPSTTDLPPHPEIEILRAQLMAKLRTNYQEMCHSREGRFEIFPFGTFKCFIEFAFYSKN